MKKLYKNILSVSLLMCFVLSASAQVQQIFAPENNPESIVPPKIRIEDNRLFAITSSGVYTQNIDKTGKLEGETLSLSDLFTNVGYEIHDLVVNGEKIFVVTTNMLWEKNAILKSEDGGKTWIDLADWEDLEYHNYYQWKSNILYIRFWQYMGEKGNIMGIVSKNTPSKIKHICCLV